MIRVLLIATSCSVTNRFLPMSSSLVLQHALQRLTLLRAASILTWLAFILYLRYQHLTDLSYNGLLLIPYTLLFLAGAWQARHTQLESKHLLVQLVLECQLLTAMLFFSGGAANPLISYFLVLLLIAAYSLPLKQTIGLTTLCILDYSLLMLWHQPLASHALNSDKSLFDLHLVGMWLNFVVSAVIFAALIPAMVQSRGRQRQEIQRLREQQLKNEQLIGIATLAAGTAHEMGTPLMTMQMLLNELEPSKTINQEDFFILKTQVERCRKSLMRLSTAGRDVQKVSEQNAYTWLTNLLERWRLSHPKAQWQDNGLNSDACIVASPLLDQALLNLLDNAAEAGNSPVQLFSTVETGVWSLHILQPDAQAAQNLQRLHNFSSSKEHGLGLGLYLSNASVEQFGGNILLQAQADGSTLCILSLPICYKDECQ